MVASVNESPSQEVLFFADTSGEPGVDPVFTTTTLWCHSSSLPKISDQLNVFRKMHGYERDVHFSELGKQNHRFGGPENLALDWIRWFCKSDCFGLKCYCHVVPKQGFDMKYYGDSRRRASNFVLKMNILFALANAFTRDTTISLKGYYDGSVEDFGAPDDVLQYLRREVRWASVSRASQPRVASTFDVSAVPRSPLSQDAKTRSLQDLVALADLIGGAIRRKASGFGSERSAKDHVANMTSDLLASDVLLPDQQRRLQVCEWRPPRSPRLINSVAQLAGYVGGVGFALNQAA